MSSGIVTVFVVVQTTPLKNGTHIAEVRLPSIIKVVDEEKVLISGNLCSSSTSTRQRLSSPR